MKNHTQKPCGLRPFGDRLLIEPLSTMQSGAIHLPDVAMKPDPQEWVIRAVGPKANPTEDDCARPPHWFINGNRVLIPKHIGIDIGINGKLHKLIHASEVLAVLS